MDRYQIPFLESAVLKCSDVEDLLDCYLDNEMIPLLRERFNSHLVSCAECRDLVSDCSHIVEVAKTLDDVPIPSEVSLRLRQALREELGYNVIPLRPKLSVVKP
ncbi:MAG: zf-HC2 domain-containing protein [Deltaproteobacteria bacterium]|nr:zf-HC2 domain-containing protein [Deltaproteobacteria bacterium]